MMDFLKRNLGVILFLLGAWILACCVAYSAAFIWPFYHASSTLESYRQVKALEDPLDNFIVIGGLLALIGIFLAPIQITLRSFRARANKQRKDF